MPARKIENQKKTCVVRSSSGDIDIPVILLANVRPNLTVYIDKGTGRNRQVLSLPSCQLSEAEKKPFSECTPSLVMIIFFLYAQSKESVLEASQR